jgi:DNA-binding transcriptional ArsR family regulator
VVAMHTSTASGSSTRHGQCRSTGLRLVANEVLLTQACRPVRASVGPVAWVVLEELVMAGESAGSMVSVMTTVRQLGEAVGLSKDTVAAALRRLIADGLVVRVDEREGGSGRFGRSAYSVELGAVGVEARRVESPGPVRSDTDGSGEADRSVLATDARPVAPSPSRRNRSSNAGSQLSLLDQADDPR